MSSSESVADGTNELWKRYLDDFMFHKFQLRPNAGPIAQYFSIHLLQDYFRPLQQESNILRRLLCLHAHVHVHKLSLARATSLLRMLNKLDSDLPSTTQPSSSVSMSQANHPSGHIIQNRQEDFAIFIINRFFATLRALFKSQPDGKVLRSWYKVCQDMVSIAT